MIDKEEAVLDRLLHYLYEARQNLWTNQPIPAFENIEAAIEQVKDWKEINWALSGEL